MLLSSVLFSLALAPLLEFHVCLGRGASSDSPSTPHDCVIGQTLAPGSCPATAPGDVPRTLLGPAVVRRVAPYVLPARVGERRPNISSFDMWTYANVDLVSSLVGSAWRCRWGQTRRPARSTTSAECST